MRFAATNIPCHLRIRNHFLVATPTVYAILKEVSIAFSATIPCQILWMFMARNLLYRQGYGLKPFKRYASTCTMSYTVADLGVVGYHQHYLFQIGLDKD